MTDAPCAACALAVPISLFDNEKDKRPKGELLPWGTLRGRLLKFQLRSEKSGPAWSPTEYDEGATRGNAGVDLVSVAVMDVDDGTDPAGVHRRLKGLGVEHVVHSTHSSTAQHPKFRLAVPFAEPVSAEEWSRRFPAICAYLTECHTDPSTSDAARMYYLPSAKPGAHTFSYAVHGRALLLAELPEEVAPSGTAPSAPEPERELRSELPKIPGPADDSTVLDRIFDGPNGELHRGFHERFVLAGRHADHTAYLGWTTALLFAGATEEQVPRLSGFDTASWEHEGCAIWRSLAKNGGYHRRREAILRSPAYREIEAAVREELGRAGKPVPAAPVAGADAAKKPRKDEPSAATRLARLARERAFLFHDESRGCYATLRVEGHDETYRIKSTAVRQWLGRLLFEDSGSAAPADALASATLLLEGEAQYNGPQIAAHLRVAEHEGELWIDLGDPEWRAVRVTREGWSVEAKAPVKFIRGRTTCAFPEPVRGGSLADLAPLLNATSTSERHFVLCVAWLLGAFHPRGPYPVLFIHGEQGSGKSFGSRFLRRLADPSSNELRSLPKNEHDLAVAAVGSRVLAFDNASKIPDQISDAICRLSTGGGFATRELYTDGEEVVFDGKRPVIVNGIPVLAESADLRDRALVVEWPVPKRKKKEKELLAEFNEALSRLFGVTLDALVLAVRDEATMNPRSDLRMMDVAAWVMAAEPALPWPAGTFEATYADARAGLASEAVTSSPLAEAVRALAAAGPWEGTATRLLPELARLAAPPVDPTKPTPHGWPKSPKVLGDQLRRLAPDLRAVGVSVTFDRIGKGRSRTIWVAPLAPEGSGKSASAASATLDRMADEEADADRGADALASGPEALCPPDMPSAADEADAEKHPSSGDLPSGAGETVASVRRAAGEAFDQAVREERGG